MASRHLPVRHVWHTDGTTSASRKPVSMLAIGATAVCPSCIHMVRPGPADTNCSGGPTWAGASIGPRLTARTSLRIRRLGVRVPPSAHLPNGESEQVKGPAPIRSGAFIVPGRGRYVPNRVPQRHVPHEQVSPEHVRSHHVARSTIRELLDQSGRRAPTELVELARRVGATP
jgi:hypothetical protein